MADTTFDASDWSGPYLNDLTATEIDAAIDNLYDIGMPNGAEDVTDATRNFVKWQMTAPFQCAKFGDLCEVMTEEGAKMMVGGIFNQAATATNLDDLFVSIEIMQDGISEATSGNLHYIMTADEQQLFKDAKWNIEGTTTPQHSRATKKPTITVTATGEWVNPIWEADIIDKWEDWFWSLRQNPTDWKPAPWPPGEEPSIELWVKAQYSEIIGIGSMSAKAFGIPSSMAPPTTLSLLAEFRKNSPDPNVTDGRLHTWDNHFAQIEGTRLSFQGPYFLVADDNENDIRRSIYAAGAGWEQKDGDTWSSDGSAVTEGNIDP